MNSLFSLIKFLVEFCFVCFHPSYHLVFPVLLFQLDLISYIVKYLYMEFGTNQRVFQLFSNLSGKLCRTCWTWHFNFNPSIPITLWGRIWNVYISVKCIWFSNGVKLDWWRSESGLFISITVTIFFTCSPVSPESSTCFFFLYFLFLFDDFLFFFHLNIILTLFLFLLYQFPFLSMDNIIYNLLIIGIFCKLSWSRLLFTFTQFSPPSRFFRLT